MKMLKKVVAITLATMIMGVLGACEPDYYPEYESGYYRYAVKTEKDGTQKAYILGLTESGLEQTVLIYPEEIEGIPVYGIGYNLQLIYGTEGVGFFYGANLEKIFFSTMMKECVANSVISTFQNTYTIYWDCGQIGERTHGISAVKGMIYGFNFYCSYIKQKPIYDNCNRIANVTYLYNYEDAPNENYYWVDSYDESVITFIPPEPEREGYTFEGWYKESECLHEWDFSVDITGKEIVLSPNKTYDSYEGIYLYAKWIAE